MNQDEINSLNDNTDIVSLVSKYVKLEKQGKNYKGLCPFHNEKTPSFIVSPEKHMYNCFGCHKSGNPLKFIQDIENVDFKSALRMLCEFNGIEYKDAPIKENPYTKYYKLMNTAKEFYNRFLIDDSSSVKALDYLHQRGITDEIIKDFEIGLAPNNYDTIYHLLSDMNYLELDMADCGLVDLGKNNKYHDLFVDRIMFPIKDDNNNTIAFSARIYEKKADQPKYINSRETKIFKKDTVLFNINNAKREIIKKNRIIIHEGQMDVIAAYKSDLKETVCTLGSSIGDKQAQYISKLTKNVVLCYDGDKAGISSSKKAINLFHKYGFNIHLVLLPDGMDTDEYVMKYGPEKYREYFLGHMVDEIEYLYQIALIGNDLNDKNQLNKVKNEVFNIISSLNSQIEEEKYLKRFSEYLNSSLEAVIGDYNKSKSINVVQDIKPTIKKPEKANKYNSECELRLIYYAMKSKKDALLIDDEIKNDLIAFSSDSVTLWFSLVNTYYEEYDVFDPQKFVNILSDSAFEQYKLLNNVLKKSLNQDFNKEDMMACIKKIKDMKEDIKIKKLHELNLSSTDDTEKSRNVDEMFKNRRNKEKRKHEGEM